MQSPHPYSPLSFHSEAPYYLEIIDQRDLPFKLTYRKLENVNQVATAISQMWLRGAPLIGMAAAYGMVLAVQESINKKDKEWINQCYQQLLQTRPTAVNLSIALNRVMRAMQEDSSPERRLESAVREARLIAREEEQACYRIGRNGLDLIKNIAKSKKGEPVQILTHCNAGWLACGQWGTATAPVYQAWQEGIPIHVWVDETRPRNQGMLTAWELGKQGIPHTIITDNAGGLLMQTGKVDLCIVGTDRTFADGTVINKVGTYLKALAAKQHNVPFYIALPGSSVDWAETSNLDCIEYRPGEELEYISGLYNKEIIKVRISPENSYVLNPAFDITPPEFITAFITEQGIYAPDQLTSLPKPIDKRKHSTYA